MLYSIRLLSGLVRGLVFAGMFMLGLYNAGLCAETPLRLSTPRGELTIDDRGLSLTPTDASCPTVQACGEAVWSIWLETAGKPPLKEPPINIDNLRQSVVRTKIPNGIRLEYGQLTAGKRTWQIGVTLDIHCEGDGFAVTGTIRNDEPGWVVRSFIGPVLHGIQCDLATHPILMPDGVGRRIQRVPNGKSTAPWYPWGNRFGASVDYPSRAGTMQWCAFAGPQGGLYFGCHDAAHGGKNFCARYNPADKRFGLAVKQEHFCAAGQTWKLPPTIILPYKGDWHAAARYYRRWIDAATPVRTPTPWVRDASGWLLCILKQQNGEVMWDYPSLTKLCDVADERGIDILGLFGWAHGGHDHLYPEYHPDPLMGGRKALQDALAAAHRRGKRVILYANGQLMERNTEYWKKHCRQLAIVKRNGVTEQQRWHKYKNAPSYEFDLGCLAAQGWRDQLVALAEQANALGADGILFDQLGVMGPMACYAEGHGHPVPAMVYTEDRTQFLRQVMEHMQKINPQFIIMTEGLHDAALNSISLFHGCEFGVYAVSPAEIAARLQASGASAAFPEMFRYTYPEMLTTMRVPTPMMDRVTANYTCVYGFRYEIESRYMPDVRYLREQRIPEAAEYAQVLSRPNIKMMQTVPAAEATRYLKRIIEFQRAHADLLWRGRFVDTDGIEFSGPNLVAKAYAADDRIGVLVWNPSDSAAKAFTLTVPGAELTAAAEPEKGTVKADDPLGPQTVRLLVWKKNAAK